MPVSPAFDQDRFLALCGDILSGITGLHGEVRLVGTLAGTINLVLRLDWRGRALGARVGVNAHRLRYPHGCLKEALSGLLLSVDHSRLEAAQLRAVAALVLASPKGGPVDHPFGHHLLHYDASRADCPFPFALFDWIEGRALWEVPDRAAYGRAGALLARLHATRFADFHDDVFAAEETPGGWVERMRLSFAREMAQACAQGLDVRALRRAVALSRRLAFVPAGEACLVHNDFSGANLIDDGAGRLCLVDWDNWVAACPELDAVKMKHWTRIGPDGMLVADQSLFTAFRDGYRAAAGVDFDDERLAVCEGLWLLKVFNFERASEGEADNVAGRPGWRSVYPPAGVYAERLRDF